MTDRVYTTVDVAKLCKVSLRTVIRWVDEGKLPSFRTPGGHRRVREEDLTKFMEQYKIPFSVKPRDEVKKILILEEKKNVEKMLHQILRRSSDVFEIARAKDLYECAVRLGILMPDLVILEGGAKTQEIEKFVKSLKQVSEAKDARILVLSKSSSGLQQSKVLGGDQVAIVAEPVSVEKLRPHLLEMMGASPQRS